MKFKISSFNTILINFYWTALHKAVKDGKREIIKLLLEQPNINVNIENEILIINI